MAVLSFKVSQDNICIYNAYEAKSSKQMHDHINCIRKLYTKDECKVLARSNGSIIREWRGHNCLYTLGIAIERTKDADINYDVPWYAHIGYALLSCAYCIVKLFSK